MIISTEAITLHTRKYSESSKIATLFSRDEGLIKVIAKGARQTKSKFGSALDPLTYCAVQYYKKPHSDLHLLSKAEIFKPLRHIHSSVPHLAAGLLILESIAQTQSDNEKNESLFQLLAKTIILLNELKENPFSLFVAFEIQLAVELGFGLNFDDVDNDIQKYGSDYYFRFSLESGALLAQNFPVYNYSFKINQEALAYMKNISEQPAESAAEINIRENLKQHICDFFAKYFSYHLDKKFAYRSFDILNI